MNLNIFTEYVFDHQIFKTVKNEFVKNSELTLSCLEPSTYIGNRSASFEFASFFNGCQFLKQRICSPRQILFFKSRLVKEVGRSGLRLNEVLF